MSSSRMNSASCTFLSAKRQRAFFGYSVNYSGPKGNAEFEVVVSGDNKNGIVNVSLRRRTGVWTIIAANLRVENTGDPIGLL